MCIEERIFFTYGLTSCLKRIIITSSVGKISLEHYVTVLLHSRISTYIYIYIWYIQLINRNGYQNITVYTKQKGRCSLTCSRNRAGVHLELASENGLADSSEFLSALSISPVHPRFQPFVTL